MTNALGALKKYILRLSHLYLNAKDKDHLDMRL